MKQEKIKIHNLGFASEHWAIIEESYQSDDLDWQYDDPEFETDEVTGRLYYSRPNKKSKTAKALKSFDIDGSVITVEFKGEFEKVSDSHGFNDDKTEDYTETRIKDWNVVDIEPENDNISIETIEKEVKNFLERNNFIQND